TINCDATTDRINIRQDIAERKFKTLINAMHLAVADDRRRLLAEEDTLCVIDGDLSLTFPSLPAMVHAFRHFDVQPVKPDDIAGLSAANLRPRQNPILLFRLNLDFPAFYSSLESFPQAKHPEYTFLRLIPTKMGQLVDSSGRFVGGYEI